MKTASKAAQAADSSNTPPIKICPACFYVMASARRVCTKCGFEFYPSRKKGGAA